MNYLVSSTYYITYFNYTEIELKFMKKTYELSLKYPFKWYEFINKIMQDKIATYFKDTTMIINLMELELNQVKILFEILKEYLKLKLLKKIIYKKEFIIIHFYTEKTKEIFASPRLWLAINTYFILKERNPELDLTFGGVLNSSSIKEEVDLVLIYRERTYLINVSHPLQKNYEDTSKVMIVDDVVSNDKLPENIQKVKFSFDAKTLSTNFFRVLEHEYKQSLAL